MSSQPAWLSRCRPIRATSLQLKWITEMGRGGPHPKYPDRSWQVLTSCQACHRHVTHRQQHGHHETRREPMLHAIASRCKLTTIWPGQVVLPSAHLPRVPFRAASTELPAYPRASKLSASLCISQHSRRTSACAMDNGGDKAAPSMPAELPAGMEREAAALAAFLDLSNVAKAWFSSNNPVNTQLTVGPHTHLTSI